MIQRALCFVSLALLAACGEGSVGGSGGGTNPGTPAPHATATVGPLPAARYWILQGAAGSSMATDPVGSVYFGQGNHITLVSDDVAPPTTWATIVFHVFTSYNDFQTAIANGTIATNVTAVMYDNEEEPGWTATPANEQADPVGYMESFAALAAKHSYVVIGTHAGGGSNEKSIDSGMAPVCNFFAIQTQYNELETPAPQSYNGFTSVLYSAVHAASPNTVVIGGLTTSVQGTLATPQQIDQAIGATDNTVSGYWLNIPVQSPFDPNGPPQSEYSAEVQVASQALAALPTPGP